MEDIIFIKVCRYFEIFFNRYIIAFFETTVLKEVRILRSTITAQCYYQSSKIKVSYTILILDKLS